MQVGDFALAFKPVSIDYINELGVKNETRNTIKVRNKKG